MIPAPKPKEKTIVPCPPGTCPKCGGTTFNADRTFCLDCRALFEIRDDAAQQEKKTTAAQAPLF